MPIHDIRRLGPDDLDLHARLMTLFGEAFEDPATYTGARPGPDDVRWLLNDQGFVALIALSDGAVIGGLAAYELVKFERERSEFYIYDLAVAAGFRRKGVATALGAFLYLAPVAVLGCLLVFVASVYLSGYVSLGSLLGSASILLWLTLLQAPAWKVGLAAFIVLMIWIKHFQNIQRLLRGTEKSWKKKVEA